MNNSKSYEWEGSDLRLDKLSSKEIITIYLINKIAPFLTFLTSFYPFSLLWQDRRFHFNHKRIVNVDDLIIKIAKEKHFWFKLLSYDEDNLFLNIYGKFIPLNKTGNLNDLFDYFREKMNKEDFYINDLNDGRVKISLMQKR